MKSHVPIPKDRQASLAATMILLLAVLLTIACGSSSDSPQTAVPDSPKTAVPDSAKSAEMIAGELYECLGKIDLGIGSVAEGLRQAGLSKDEIVEMLTELATKQELIEERDACLSLGE